MQAEADPRSGADEVPVPTRERLEHVNPLGEAIPFVDHRDDDPAGGLHARTFTTAFPGEYLSALSSRWPST